ncbi:hypothetical protein ACFFF5_21015 [Lederbergia wuyishanensis]|uniref:DUF4352 domain-containing protein n=1 Tax=Lederbergia wuyishanensis TaxID=1347903 RepID=A0ABU0D722_9BACI|nr:hypothetical protein [Lederbergia wuyishanensis]MCJ8008898.1 hypothetical protein [Lederbergia wuyishanensis]MDQ0344223.1 hypothetical protein [Lederbergia wuyishanensis]
MTLEKEEKKKKERALAKGCSIGCGGLIILMLIGFLISQFVSKEDKVKPKEVQGIDVKMSIDSNNMFIDEAIVIATITNTTDKTYSGEVSIYHSSFKYWKIEVENLAPDQEITRQIKEKYIEHPEDEYRYSVVGELSDKSYKSNVDYTVFKTESDRSFNIQIEKANKENIIEVTTEMYSLHGDNLINLSFYDNSVKLVDGELTDASPVALYFGSNKEKTITIYYDDGTEEQMDFEPKK